MPTWRVIVEPQIGMSDPQGRAVSHQIADLHQSQVRSAKIYLFDIPANASADAATRNAADQRLVIESVAAELLTDPVAEISRCEISDSMGDGAGGSVVEIHLKPGVMDPVAIATQSAIERMGIRVESVRSARRLRFETPIPAELQPCIARRLGNGCIEDVVYGIRPLTPAPKPPVYQYKLRHVAIRELDTLALDRLSRDGHLFLSRNEMLVIQKHYRSLGRDPTDLELETIAQTWSEHCIHKTLKSAIEYRGAAMPGLGEEARRHEVTDARREGTEGQRDKGKESESNAGPDSVVEIHYDNLLKDTIAAATDELMRTNRGPTCLSVFKDNAGIIAFDDEYGIAVKVETHNHPSAIEPYGGAATGVGGVIRDVLGCGLGAKPIANTDVFCVAPPDWPDDAVPSGVIHPRSVLRGVVSGVRDYGNCMGIPTVNGAVHFDPRYLGNPLVYCGCIGLIPRDRIEKAARPGDAIIVIGGRTGRDGIHGATFSSAELTDTHTDEFAHAVQIGNPLEEKKVLDLIMLARDYRGEARHEGTQARTHEGENNIGRNRGRCLFSAITDCGAGGLSSAIGEMAEQTGAIVDLEKVTLKYAGLRYDEIWISEAQERMVLAVPQQDVDKFMQLAASEDVEATVVGQFTSDHRLIVRYQGNVVGDLDLGFLHGGLPKTKRIARWEGQRDQGTKGQSGIDTTRNDPTLDLRDELRNRLSNPTIASKQWIIRQYDHEVQGRSVVKPLVGPGQGPSDAAVIRPRLDSHRGIAIGCGFAPDLYEADPYWMAVAGIDEAIRNIVCVGGDPRQTAILDNFCWPRVDDERNLGALVRACQACRDAALAYGVPFISGKDSLNNAFALDESDIASLKRTIDRYGLDGANALRGGRLSIPGTLLITAASLIDDVSRCVTSDLKRPGSRIVLVGGRQAWPIPRSDSPDHPFRMDDVLAIHQFVSSTIQQGWASAVHDVSDGGVLVAAAEMAIGGRLGIELLPAGESIASVDRSPTPGSYLIELNDRGAMETEMMLKALGAVDFGITRAADEISSHINGIELGEIWRRTLDW